MKALFKFSLVVIACASVVGCGTSMRQRSVSDSKSTDLMAQAQFRQFIDEVRQSERNRVAASDVQKPYVAGNAIPLSREATMPEQLRKSLPTTSLFSSGQVDMATAMQQLSAAMDMSVTATPDALMPPGAFAPRTSITNSGVQAPPKVLLKSLNMPIWRLLDDVAAQTATSWRPTAIGAEFFRVETKVYDIQSVSQSATTTAAMGRNSNTKDAFDSQAKTTFTFEKQNALDAFVKPVEGLLSMGGKLVVSPEAQTLIVTDTPAAQERVAAYVKEKNKSMSRRIRMVLEAIQVARKDADDFGLDWNLVYNTTSKVLGTTPLASLGGANDATFSATQASGLFAGSSLVVRALNEIGSVVGRTTFPLVSTSGRPVTQALRKTFNYVDHVQMSSVASGSTTIIPSPSVVQKDETVGTLLTLIPTAKSDGTIILSVHFDVTTAQPLVPYTVGTGASAVTVQQKTIDGSGFIQEVPIRTGRTEIIGGIEQITNSNTARRLGENLPILAGGSNSTGLSKNVTLLLVTAYTEEGY